VVVSSLSLSCKSGVTIAVIVNPSPVQSSLVQSSFHALVLLMHKHMATIQQPASGAKLSQRCCTCLWQPGVLMVKLVANERSPAELVMCVFCWEVSCASSWICCTNAVKSTDGVVARDCSASGDAICCCSVSCRILQPAGFRLLHSARHPL
jgi:hypothetical protein